MRTGAIEKRAVFTDNVSRVLFTQNQDVVQTLPSDTANEPFANRVRLGRIGWRVDQLDASPVGATY